MTESPIARLLMVGLVLFTGAMGGFAAYDRLAETCHQLLADPAGRARIAEEGFARIKAFSQADMLKAALAVTP